MKSSFKSLSTALLLAATGLLVLPAEAATRIAIGTLGVTPEKRNANLADLLTADLSSATGLEMVERRELDRALNEAGLSASGVVRGKDAIRLGAFLRADEFVLGTAVNFNGTNRLVIRLVDARTGVMRAINVFPDAGREEALAASIATFVRTEAARPLGERHDYLAVGVVQNQGVINRFANFPAQMRGSVAAGLSGKVTVLERDVISFLADEARMEATGLTAGAAGDKPSVQCAFWIVDGFYQSYEVAEPEVQLKLRVERVQGAEQSFMLQAKPDEQFFKKICDTIEQALQHPAGNGVTPGKAGEIAALEARAAQLVDYVPSSYFFPCAVRLRTALNPDKVTNTLDEAVKVFESILLLDPNNNAAKMRLGACLTLDTHLWSRSKREDAPEREARAREYFREVIASADPKTADDARMSLAAATAGLAGIELLDKFAAEIADPARKLNLRRFRSHQLCQLEYDLPVETALPYLKKQLWEELTDVEQSTNGSPSVNFNEVLFAYRFHPDKRVRIVNELLPEMLAKFPKLTPYILISVAGEQTGAESPVTAQFLASLKDCQAHPENVWRPTNYFTHLCSTSDEERDAHLHGEINTTPYQRAFNNHQYPTVIAEALARQAAAQKGLAVPLTPLNKQRLAESYFALQQWKPALDLFEQLPGIKPEVKNQCRSHLGLDLLSEAVPQSVWQGSNDIGRVLIAFGCIQRQQWLEAAEILDSMEHRTVRMNSSGPWGFAFTPVFPALVADECRAKAGQPRLKDPMRFEIEETPYILFNPPGLRMYTIQAEGDDLWMATYSQIKVFRGPGPFEAIKPVEMHEFQRNTKGGNTAICVSPDYIWAGSYDDGMVEMDRKTGAFRYFNVDNGLPLKSISGLALQGDTLWISYRNGENGAVGTMDVRTHKFSTMTPMLSPQAGTDSRPHHSEEQHDGYSSAPVHLVTSMHMGAPDDMWVAVMDKGLQRYHARENRWETLSAVSPTDSLIQSIALDPAHQRVLAGRRSKDTYNSRDKYGGLIIHNYANGNHARIGTGLGLPSNDVTAVATDGRVAWVGGRGFVALVDLAEQKVLRIGYISTSNVAGIQLSKNYVWLRVICDVDGNPDWSGNARTGVYRIDRAAVENGVMTISQK